MRENLGKQAIVFFPFKKIMPLTRVTAIHSEILKFPFISQFVIQRGSKIYNRYLLKLIHLKI